MEPLLSLGRVLRKAGAFAKSADTYRTALDLDASNTTALRGLGNALIALDQSNRALPRFNAAIMVDPNDALAYNGKGVALDMTGDHRSAQQAYYRGLELDRGNRILQNNLGLSLALSGNYADSIRVLEGVTTKGGATAQNRQNLALAYGLAGRNDDAEEMSRLDLRDDAVRNNLNYYNILRARAEKAKKTDSEPTAKP
jgi:Flp pilus assembly protein TadD